jgi:putative aminopeptidase FrvX
MLDVPEKGEKLTVRRTANLHSGGTIHDVTGSLHPIVARAAMDAARLLRIPVVGPDFMVREASDPDYVTIAMQDSSGPFDWRLTRSLIRLCEERGIEHSRDVFRHYRSDAAAAVEAGNDIRAALVCFGLDASHGYERVHMDSLIALATHLTLYMRSEPLYERDVETLGPPGDLPAGRG